MSFRPGAAVIGLVLALTGCNAWQNRAEFGPPQSRWNAAGSSPVSADAGPPPIPVQYCYRTLATVDCFDAAKPERVTGYTGLYPAPASLPPSSIPPAPR